MVHLSVQADQDIEDILDWTLEHFGPLQLEIYTGVINDALEALLEGPESTGVRWLSELGDDIAILHVTRQDRKGRHLVVFRVHERECLIEVLRILHDSMDLVRHLYT